MCFGRSRKAPSVLKIGIEAENRQRSPMAEGHTPFPIREWGPFPPESCQRRILSGVLPERKPAISRGNWTMREEKGQIARTLRLYGGPGRDRTDDLFHAMEARSQLRHRPTNKLLLVYTSKRPCQLSVGVETRDWSKFGRQEAAEANGAIQFLHADSEMSISIVKMAACFM